MLFNLYFSSLFLPFYIISWKEAIEVKDEEGFCLMKKLLEKFPEVAKV